MPLATRTKRAWLAKTFLLVPPARIPVGRVVALQLAWAGRALKKGAGGGRGTPGRAGRAQQRPVCV